MGAFSQLVMFTFSGVTNSTIVSWLPHVRTRSKELRCSVQSMPLLTYTQPMSASCRWNTCGSRGVLSMVFVQAGALKPSPSATAIRQQDRSVGESVIHTWSWMRDTSGETTTVTPLATTAGSW